MYLSVICECIGDFRYTRTHVYLIHNNMQRARRGVSSAFRFRVKIGFNNARCVLHVINYPPLDTSLLCLWYVVYIRTREKMRFCYLPNDWSIRILFKYTFVYITAERCSTITVQTLILILVQYLFHKTNVDIII